VPYTSATREGFSITLVPSRTEITVAIEGELDVAGAHDVQREVRDLRRTGFDHVVLDLRKLAFIDSTGLRALLALRDDAARDHARLTLIPAPPDTQRIFDVSGTSDLFAWRRGAR
jgi:anti-anti-sigma factor